MPHPKDLTDFWQQVELALKAIDPSVRPELLGHRAIDLLGPLILGPGGWALITKPEPFTGSWLAMNIPAMSAMPSGSPQHCWGNFRAATEATFGLTPVQRKARFFQLTRKTDERSEDFVARVEETRVRLAIDAPIDEKAVFLAFSKQLSGGLARRVKAR